MGRPEHWTEERLRELASGYEFISDFTRDHEGAYGAMKTRHQHLKKELFPTFKKLVWTKEKLAEEASKYDRRVDFRNGASGAYTRAYQTGMLDEICAHMVNGRLQGAFDLGEYLDISGLYFLYKDSEIVYIGKSESCVVDRIRWHYSSKRFDEVRIYPVTNIADILILETYLIAKIKPIHNVEYKPECMPTVLIDNAWSILGDPIIVGASFGVNGLNTHKGK